MVPDGAEALRTFWSRMKFRPGFQNHPLLDVPSFQERAIPINLHGDCVPITGIGKVWAKNLLALHWSSALCKGNSKDICLLTFTVLWMLFEWFLHFLQFLFWQHTTGSYFTSAIIGGYCLCTRLLEVIAQVFDKLASTAEGGTMDSVWQILSWSFNCMQSGKWPRRDHLGHLWLSLHHVQLP